jgi:hypothetical protein
MKDKIIQYCFTLTDGSQEIFNLHFDAETLALKDNTPGKLPLWTKLDFHQCSNCPLDSNIHPHCPIAVNLVNIVSGFHDLAPHEEVHVDVITEERLIAQDTTVQSGISSLMGLVMATSGCPRTAFFRPMARFHLALASEEETVYRAASMYLLAQYFLKKEEKNMDFTLEGLTKIYRNIHLVNTAIVERLRAAKENDPALNAIVLLDMYALFLPHVVGKSLEEIQYLFHPFINDEYKLLEEE